jgi:hypothetical protein
VADSQRRSNVSHELREIDGRTWRYCNDCHRYHGRQKCKWCGKGYKTPKGLADHEPMCYLNPKRPTCTNCGGEGGKWKHVYDSHGYSVDGDFLECPYCAEMEERRTLEWWAQYGDDVPEDERQMTCAEARERLAKEVAR